MMRRSGCARWVSCRGLACVAFLAVAIFCLAFWWTDLVHAFSSFETHAETWRREQPAAVAIGGILSICVWIICLVPSTPIELTVAYLYGLGWGLAIVYTGKVLGCMCSFVLGRTLLHDCCRRQLERVKLLRAIDRAVNKQPLRISLMARGAYIPIALKNYGFAVLSVPVRAFTIALVTVEFYNSLVCSLCNQ